jgi:nicotinamidase-related amidase
MYTLIVVDMQETFRASTRDRVRKNCSREVKQAIKDDAHIIFLEYRYSGRTLPELTEALHTKCFFKEKSEDDGSAEVESTVVLNKLPKHFKVCGVNTDCCVYATVRGLTARFPMATIDVIIDACDSDWNHLGGIDKLTAMKGNVNVKHAKEETNV